MSPEPADLLFTVEDTFFIGGESPAPRLVLGPGFHGGIAALPGTPIILEFPDGTRHATTIAGVGMFDPNPSGTHPITLPSSFGKGSVPIGTRVWLNR